MVYQCFISCHYLFGKERSALLVLVSVKVMVIQHIKHNFFSYSNAELQLYNLSYKQYSCNMDLNYKYNIGYVMKTDKTC